MPPLSIAKSEMKLITKIFTHRFGKTVFSLAALILSNGLQTVHAEELPDILVPDEWRTCESADDCDFVTEGCRSCQVVVLNKKHIEEYTAADFELRKKHNFQKKCEACSNNSWKISCQNRKCVASIQLADRLHFDH